MSNLLIWSFSKASVTVLERLEDSGHKAYLVGGCLRDMMMGREPHDFDIATSAEPETVMSIFSDFEVIPTGIKHGTVTVMIDGEPIEITTFRKDSDYSDGRRPDSITFTDKFETEEAEEAFIKEFVNDEIEALTNTLNELAEEMAYETKLKDEEILKAYRKLKS